MKIKVSELEGEKLDYWTAKAGEVWKTAHEMFPTWTMDPRFKGVEIVDGKCVLIPNNPFRQDPKIYSPSSDWSQGGPIIEREEITISPVDRGLWGAEIELSRVIYEQGPTPLIAAMRCFVYSKFGEEVEE